MKTRIFLATVLSLIIAASMLAQDTSTEFVSKRLVDDKAVAVWKNWSLCVKELVC